MTLRNIFAVLFLFAAGLQTVWAQKFVVKTKDNQSAEYDLLQLNKISCFDSESSKITIDLNTNQSVEYNVSQLESIDFTDDDDGWVIDDIHGVSDGHRWVNLGLPSGTLWATQNVGAGTYGYYYAWGETQPKAFYSWETYKHCNGNEYTINKYVTDFYDYGIYDDEKTELEPEDDAATMNWGGNWQTPSKEQFNELIAGTDIEWGFANGPGIVMTSKYNGVSIFLPAGGCYCDDIPDVVGEYGFYWTRSLIVEEPMLAHSYAFYPNLYILGANSGWYRYEGRLVRPVRKQ